MSKVPGLNASEIVHRMRDALATINVAAGYSRTIRKVHVRHRVPTASSLDELPSLSVMYLNSTWQGESSRTYVRTINIEIQVSLKDGTDEDMMDDFLAIVDDVKACLDANRSWRGDDNIPFASGTILTADNFEIPGSDTSAGSTASAGRISVQVELRELARKEAGNFQ